MPMPRSFLGSGVALNHVGNYGTMIDLHRAVNPTTMLGMIDNLHDMPLLWGFKNDLPGSQVIARVYHREEGAYAQPPQGKDDHRPMIAKPEDVLNDQESLGHNGMWLHVMNEPSGFLSDEEVEFTVDWLVKFIRLAAPEKCACVLGNLADQHPRIVDGRWASLWNPFLLEMAKYPTLMRLGLHYYGPDPFMRVTDALFESCRDLQINPPQIVGTEFGLDSTGQGDKANGYHNRGMTGRQYLKWEGEAIQGPLKPLIQSGILLGVDTFQWNILWGDFSPAKDQGYQDAYKETALEGFLDVTVPAAIATPYTPGQLPDTATGGFLYTVKFPKGGSVFRNLRALPDAGSTDLGDVKNGDTVKLFDLPIVYDNLQRKWQACILYDKANNVVGTGWLWTNDIQLTPLTLPDATPAPAPAPVVPPVPDPIPVPPVEHWPDPAPAPLPAPEPVKLWNIGFQLKGTTSQRDMFLKGMETFVMACAFIGMAAGVEATAVAEEVAQ
jgi:hypothetical protein